MEFVHESEVADILREHGLTPVPVGEDEVHLAMDDEEGVSRLHVACRESKAKTQAGAQVIRMDKDRLPKTLEHVIRLLGADQILLIPVGKWRKVFDAVAFSLADNEEWQTIDAAATVELNTRDPLLCESGDVHTLLLLVQTLLNDAEKPDQGLFLVPAGAPALLEIVPDGAIRMCFGNAVLAEQVAGALAA